MKLDRLIGILAILLNRDKVTAPYLAEKFEVSRRTISRDIDALCRAGIPIATAQGRDGGISIMEGYRLDHTLLSSAEMQAILAGLRSLDSVAGTNRYKLLMEKLAPPEVESARHISINLASFYKTSLADKIEAIHMAIAHRRAVAFDYFGPNGESHREIEPYQLVFEWASWYVYGYCPARGGFRLFKLNRLLHLKVLEQEFAWRNPPEMNLDLGRVFPHRFHVKARFAPEVKWRLIDEYGESSFSTEQDGTLLFSFGFTEQDSLFSWLLSFGDKAELLEPQELRRDLLAQAKAICAKYEKQDI